jgi:hypothetical protein
MAFNYLNWQRWSASFDNDNNAMWNYTDSVDAIATIVAADYFAPQAANLTVGDLIWIVASDLLDGEFAVVTAVDITVPSVTISVFDVMLGVGAVGTSNLASNSVTTVKIADANVTSDKLENALVKHARVTMTATNWDAMYVTPFELVAAPGATEKIILHGIKIDEDYGGTVFANGGAIHVQYDTTTLGAGPKATDTFAAATFIGLTADNTFGFTPVQSSIADATTLGKSLCLSNATGAYTGGTSSAFIVDVWYSVVDYA